MDNPYGKSLAVNLVMMLAAVAIVIFVLGALVGGQIQYLREHEKNSPETGISVDAGSP